jgi:hypothetical protein
VLESIGKIKRIKKEFAAKLGEAQSFAKSGTKNLKSSNPKGSLLRAGGRRVWEECRPPYKFWAKSVRIFSNTHRHLYRVKLFININGTNQELQIFQHYPLLC